MKDVCLCWCVLTASSAVMWIHECVRGAVVLLKRAVLCRAAVQWSQLPTLLLTIRHHSFVYVHLLPAVEYETHQKTERAKDECTWEEKREQIKAGEEASVDWRIVGLTMTWQIAATFYKLWFFVQVHHNARMAKILLVVARVFLLYVVLLRYSDWFFSILNVVARVLIYGCYMVARVFWVVSAWLLGFSQGDLLSNIGSLLHCEDYSMKIFSLCTANKFYSRGLRCAQYFNISMTPALANTTKYPMGILRW